MSLSALKQAIYERAIGTEVLTDDALTAQTGLIALLGTDTDTNEAMVAEGNFSQVVDFPALIFRVSGGAPDYRWGTDVGGIRDVIFDFEVWSNDTDGQIISDIHDLLDQLFNERRGISPLLTLTSGRIKHMEALTDLYVIYDREANAWFGPSRYRFILCHY